MTVDVRVLVSRGCERLLGVVSIAKGSSLLTANRSLKKPLLEAGDVMSRKEFHRRYLKMPEVKKAELIEGAVYIGPPVTYLPHGIYDGPISTWLGVYVSRTLGMGFSSSTTVKIDSQNQFQPDQVLFVRPEFGGQLLEAKKYLKGAPELVAEIASSSVSIDLGPKKKVYARAGVKEYLVVCGYDNEVDWFANRTGRFRPLSRDADGVIRSDFFPGLWLNSVALLANDLAALLATFERGLATPAHAAFVNRLDESKRERIRA